MLSLVIVTLVHSSIGQTNQRTNKQIKKTWSETVKLHGSNFKYITTTECNNHICNLWTIQIRISSCLHLLHNCSTQMQVECTVNIELQGFRPQIMSKINLNDDRLVSLEKCKNRSKMNIGKIGYGIHFPLMNSMEMAISLGQMHASIRFSINRKQSNA